MVIFSDPATALVTIATYLGILGLIAGILLIAFSFSRESGVRQFILVQGIIFSVVGLLIIVYPGGTASLMVLLMGLLILVMGFVQLFAYLQLRELTPTPGLVLFNSVLSVLVGGLLIFNPFEGAVLATFIIGAYALWFGITRLYAAWIIHKGKME